MDTVFGAYAYHNQQMEDFINALAATAVPNNFWTQHQIARDLGIRIDDFTDDEINYIENEVGRRYCYRQANLYGL